MGSDGTVPEQYALTMEKKNLSTWLAEGLVEHQTFAKIYTLTPKGESRIK